MHGVVPVEDAKFGPLQSVANSWSNKLTQAAAACNGLIMINKTTVAGDDLESALFKTVEARFLVCGATWSLANVTVLMWLTHNAYPARPSDWLHLCGRSWDA